MVSAFIDVFTDSIADGIDEYISSELEGDFEVVREANHLSLFEGYTPDIVVLQQASGIPEELQDSENLENFFPNDEFEVPRIGIEVKKGKNLFLMEEEPKIIPVGPPDSNDEYPQQLLIIDEDSLKPSDSHNYEDSEWIFVTDITNEEKVLNDIGPELVAKLSQMPNPASVEFKDVHQYIDSYSSLIHHFNEVLRGYNAGQRGALVVLLSVFFESYCHKKLEQFAERDPPNPAGGNFIEEDDRFQIKLKACRLLNLISEDEFRVIDQIRDVRNDYAHDISKYDMSRNEKISYSELDEAIEVYENIIGVEDSMVD